MPITFSNLPAEARTTANDDDIGEIGGPGPVTAAA
jgi:hypothetical protein